MPGRARSSLDQRGAVVGNFFVERYLCARASCVVPIKFLCVFVSIFDFIRVVARTEVGIYQEINPLMVLYGCVCRRQVLKNVL